LADSGSRRTLSWSKPAYEKAVGGKLVLSSAEFGGAYLAEGWATDFIRAVIRRYFIVFVGYAADDPPSNICWRR
jgi:hypothetical protein